MSNEDKYDSFRDQEHARFKQVCSVDQDPVLTILRVHLLTEYYLERIIHICIPRGDKLLDEGNLTYFQKLSVVSSFDVIKDSSLQCLKGLNKVRNQCAHGLDKQISMSEVELIGRPLGKTCTRFRRESSNSVPSFLHRVLSYLCGSIAKQVTRIENEEIEK